MTGAELPKVKGIHKDLLRIYAARAGKLEPIPFQVDERTPELEYCWTTGPEPVKDVDEGRVDEDDEVVFRAADAGDRSTESVVGATARMEVELQDPLDGGKGWAYVFAFDDKAHAPPPRSDERHVRVLPDKAGGAVFRTDAFLVASVGSVGLTGRPTGVRFLGSSGAGPLLLRDAAHLRLDASYLLAQIHREGAEARTSLGSSYIDGPVRIVAPISLEVYLIWGNWISSSKSVVFVHDHTYEVRVRFLVPVNLDRDHASLARLSFERANATEAWTARADGARLELTGEEGALVARLELDARLKAHAVGDEIAIDLTGLRKSEEATPYEVSYVLTVLPRGTSTSASVLERARDNPLRRLAR